METAVRTSMLRVGNFTSSEIAAIMSNGKEKGSMGKPAFTYVRECNMERALGRPIDNDVDARPLSWGKLTERRIFDILGMDYKLVSNETIVHPTYDFWAGSPDAQKFDEGRTVVDFKCPLTLKSFCQLVEPLRQKLSGIEAMEFLRDKDNHRDGEKFFWQLVSNAILTDSQFAELIVYVPFLDELQDIRDLAQMVDSSKQYRYFWIANAPDDQLPHLLRGGVYNNINIIRFEVPVSAKQFLIDRVRECGKLLDKTF